MKTEHDEQVQPEPLFDYEKEIQVIREHVGAVFVQVRLDHLWYLDGDCSSATVLAYLLNLLRMKDANQRDRDVLEENELWFRCPTASICSTLSVKPDKQHRAVQVLKEKRIIETEHRASHQLWIKVRTKRLDKICRSFQKRGNPVTGKTRNSTGENPELENGKPSNRENPEQYRGKPGTVPGKTRNSGTAKHAFGPGKIGMERDPENPSNKLSNKRGKEIPFASPNGKVRTLHLPSDETKARKFHGVLLDVGKMTKSTQPVIAWFRTFAKLRKGYGEERVAVVLDWYCEHIGEDFVPEAYSARSFAEKFVRTESAMNRANAERNGHVPGRREHVSAM